MAAEPLREPDRTAWLSDAKMDYEADWKVVDDELYELCRRRGRHDDFNDVYPKVAIVGRVYMAGVSRAWCGERDHDHEAETARALIEQEQANRCYRTPREPFDSCDRGSPTSHHACRGRTQESRDRCPTTSTPRRVAKTPV